PTESLPGIGPDRRFKEIDRRASRVGGTTRRPSRASWSAVDDEERSRVGRGVERARISREARRIESTLPRRRISQFLPGPFGGRVADLLIVAIGRRLRD